MIMMARKKNLDEKSLKAFQRIEKTTNIKATDNKFLVLWAYYYGLDSFLN